MLETIGIESVSDPEKQVLAVSLWKQVLLDNWLWVSPEKRYIRGQLSLYLDDSHLTQIHPLSLHLHLIWHTGLFFTSLVSTMCNETHLDESLSIDLLSSLSSIICLNQRVLGLYFTVSLQIQYVDLVNSSWRCPTDSTVLSQNPLLYNFNQKLHGLPFH